MIYFLFGGVLVGVTVIITLGVCKRIAHSSLKHILNITNKLAEGDLEVIANSKSRGMIGEIFTSLAKVTDNLTKASTFAENVGDGNFQKDFKPVSVQDRLGEALTNMQVKLQGVAEEEKKMSWVSEGLANFVGILRDNNSGLETLSDVVIKDLVNYTGVVQGVIFLLSEESSEQFLELKGCYAYERKKFINKKFGLKQSLVGQAFMERKTIFMNKVPSSYVDITSGLGEATPRFLVIVPIMANEKVEGVIELASFTEIEKYKVEFVEKVGESFAHTVSSIRGNEQMKRLLEDSEMQAQKMANQEYNVRRSNEDLARSHSEMEKQKAEMEKQKIAMEEMLSSTKIQEASLTTIINNTGSRIMAFDKEKKLIIFNNSFKSQFSGKDNIIVAGMDVLSIFDDGQVKAELDKDFTKALEGYRFKTERKIIHQGSSKIYEINYSPILSENDEVSGSSVFMEDITDYIRKNDKIRKTEQEIKEKSKILEQTRTVVNKSGLATAEFDMDGHLVDANDPFVKMFGYDSVNEIIGKKHRIFVPYKDVSTPEYKQFWQNLRDGKEPNGEYERIKREGESIWIAATYNVLKEANGKPAMVNMVAFDITETKLLYHETLALGDKLKQSEKIVQLELEEITIERDMYKSVMNGYTDGIVLFGETGKINFLNKAAQKLFGLRLKENITYTVSDILHIEMLEIDGMITPCLHSDGIEIPINSTEKHEIEITDGHNGKIPLLLSISKGKTEKERYFRAIIQRITVGQVE